ncbi:FecR domain-containing protein [Arcobacter lanthieri]|uniref:FecR family protein n=1 Tax=Aliarcobacter lanthieri TaxID=1355374 RepID=UPI001920C064|nr:FecR family protein [Aliarcobacter lanthieri]MBL3520922.1 FecR domain-containing protein [Aliarcobacter lanthieri]
MKKLFIVLFLFSNILFANIGNITILEGEAFVKRENNSIRLNFGDIIKNKDIIETKANSKVKITFIDNTIVTIGKESILKIDDYYYADDDKDGAKTEFSIPKGAFHTITGQIGKVNPTKFKLKTKNATIGIRGTEFYGDEHKIICTQGAITVFSNGILVDVPAGKYTNIFDNQQPSNAQTLENYSLDEIEEKLNTNNPNKINLDNFNNNPSSPLALDEQTNIQEHFDDQNSWGDWDTNLLALNDEKNNAKIDKVLQNKINDTKVDPNPIDPNPIDPNPIDPNPIDPNSIMTDSNYIQGLIDNSYTTDLYFSGGVYGLNTTGIINFNLSIGGGNSSIEGNFNIDQYIVNFGGEVTPYGFSTTGEGYGHSGLISAIVNGNFYGSEINKVLGTIDINDNNNIINSSFDATK